MTTEDLVDIMIDKLDEMELTPDVEPDRLRGIARELVYAVIDAETEGQTEASYDERPYNEDIWEDMYGGVNEH